MEDEEENAMAPAQKRTVDLGQSQINVFQLMEQVLEKLKLLDYERHFCRDRNMKPLNKTYFAMPSSNPNEQLFCFTSLTHWLLSQLGRDFQPPSQHDNPNAIAGVIIQELRSAGLPSDFPPAKVKQGQGDVVLQILDSGCDAVLQSKHFCWARPAHKADEYDDEAEVDDQAELDGGIDDEAVIEEEEGLYMDGLSSPGFGAREETYPSPSKEILESSVPAAQWKMELERVAPQLKTIQTVSAKEWRAHLEQTRSLKDTMDASIPQSREGLHILARDVSEGLEEIQKRERGMNGNLKHLVDDLRTRRENTAGSKEQYDDILHKVNDLTNKLAAVSDDLDDVKNRMEDRGSSMTDTGPVVSMKKSLSQVKHDSKLMDIRIGVAQHALLQAKLQNQRTTTAMSRSPSGLNGGLGHDRRDSVDDEIYD